MRSKAEYKELKALQKELTKAGLRLNKALLDRMDELRHDKEFMAQIDKEIDMHTREEYKKKVYKLSEDDTRPMAKRLPKHKRA